MATPTLVQFTCDSFQNNSTITKWPKLLPNPAGAGNLLVAVGTWGSSSATCTITDDKGNTWNAGPTLQDATNNQTLQIFWANNVASGTQKITATLSAACSFVQFAFHEFYNVSVNATPANVTDGSNSHQTTSGTSVTPGSITTATAGDLIFVASMVDGIGTLTNPLSWTPGASFTPMVLDGTSLFATEYLVQGSAGATNVGFTTGTAVTSALCCQIAFKSAAAGTAPAAGIRVNSAVITNYPLATTWSAASITLQLPTSGNLLVAVTEMNTTVAVTGITDSKGNTWVKRAQADNGSNGFSIQIWDAVNATPGGNLTVTITYAGTPGVTPITAFWDISGAATSPFDVANHSTGLLSAQTGTATGPSITPTTANGLVIAAIEQDGQTVGSATPGYLMTVQADGYQNIGLDQDGGWLHYYNPNTSAVSIAWTYINNEGAFNVGQWESVIAAYKAPATLAVVVDDTDLHQQRFSTSTRMESQFQHELQDTFAVPPVRPPFAYEDDGANMRWSDWRALHYDDSETHRALPPLPPFSIQEEFTESLNVDWRARQFEDTDTHRALPPTPPLAVQDEVSELVLPGVSEFFEEDQPGKPIVAAPAPNIGLDDLEAHIKAYDRVNLYHEDDLSTLAPTPPLSTQDDEQHTWRGWLAPAIEDDWRALPPTPPFIVPDETAEKWTATSSPAIEDDQATLPPVPPIVPFSIQDDEQHSWRGWLSPAIEDDWSTTAPVPPLAFEDDLKTISSNQIFFLVVDTDFIGTPPVPRFFGDDEQSLQRYVVAGLSALILLDEFVNAPIATGLGPPTISSLSAAVRPGIESLSAAVRPGIDAQFATTRPAIDSLGGTVRPS